MVLCVVSFTTEIYLPSGQEQLITWEHTTTDINKYKHHTKKEYLKIYEDGLYKLNYEIKWKSQENSTQPLLVSIYKICKDFRMEILNHHATVSTKDAVNLNKNYSFEFKQGERICIGAKNLSSINFIMISGQLTLSQ